MNAEAMRLGLDVLVLDHHQAPVGLPPITALVSVAATASAALQALPQHVAALRSADSVTRSG
jgi:single-stranded DNA-specific DHH superfamily exonuclease